MPRRQHHARIHVRGHIPINHPTVFDPMTAKTTEEPPQTANNTKVVAIYSSKASHLDP